MGSHEINFEQFRPRFTFTLRNVGNDSWRGWIPTALKVWVTSEKNSYGLAEDRWFDGITVNPSLFLYIEPNNARFYSRLNIHEVTEYKNIESICSKDSYYECLAKRFANEDLSKHSLTLGPITTQHNCSFTNNKCFPYSMPYSDDVISVCQYHWIPSTESKCFEQILHKLEENQETKCQKSCQVKEYQTEIDPSWNQFYSAGTFGFEYNFIKQASTNNLRSKKIFKKVKEEYFITTEVSLLGNIGGTLGMFVGFSFVGTSESVITLIGYIWKRLMAWTLKAKDKKKTGLELEDGKA